MPYHTIPKHAIPYHTIPYQNMPYHTIPHHTIPKHAIPYHTIPYHTKTCHTIPYQTIQHYTRLTLSPPLCRYVGRKWSGCGGTSTPLGQGGLGLGAGLGSSTGLFGSGGVYGSGRPPGEDLVHELLVKQDQKAACCLGLLLAACTLCWLPFAFVALVRANCPLCVSDSALAVCRWLLLANSAVNPFLYGLLNAQFRNILRQWFYLDTARRYRPKDTYIYMGVTRQDGGESVKETSNVCLSVKVP